jgi:hypothetical protein
MDVKKVNIQIEFRHSNVIGLVMLCLMQLCCATYTVKYHKEMLLERA